MAVERRGRSWHVRAFNKTTKKRDWIGSFKDDDHGGKERARHAALKAYLEAKDNPISMGRETCESFASRWTQDYCTTSRNGSPRWGEKTIRDMNGALKPFIASFGPLRLNSISTPQARSWAQGQPHGYVKVVRTMLNDAVRDGLIGANPFSNLRLEAPRGRRDFVVLTEPEIETLCDLAHEIWPQDVSFTVAAMIATAGYSGIRPGEMVALEPSDADLAAGELHVRRSYNGVEMKVPKNGKPRHIVLPPPACERIAAMPRSLRGKYLFELPRGGIFRKSKIDYYFRPIRVKFGRADFPFYGLRHTAATLLLERGMTVDLVAFQLGHEDGGKLVAELYGHPNAQRMREQLKMAWDGPTLLEAIRERKAADGG